MLKSKSKSPALVYEAQALVDKCKFLVRRGEFLYQQGLMWHAQAQELINDCAVSGRHVSRMSEKIDKLLGKSRQEQRTATGEITLPRRKSLRRKRKPLRRKK